MKVLVTDSVYTDTSVTFKWSIIYNHPPSFSTIASTSVLAYYDTTASFAVTGTDTEGESITYTVSQSNGDDIPAWMVLTADNNIKLVSGGPSNADSGLYTLKVKGTDGHNIGSEVFSYRVKYNAPPSIHTISDFSVLAFHSDIIMYTVTELDSEALTDETATLSGGGSLPGSIAY